MTKAELKRMYKDTLSKMKDMTIEYGLDELEDRLADKAKKVLAATTDAEAKAAASRALASTSISCIAHGTRRTAVWYEKNAQMCQRLADGAFRKGDDEKAEQHLRYKKKYEAEAEKLRKEGKTT